MRYENEILNLCPSKVGAYRTEFRDHQIGISLRDQELASQRKIDDEKQEWLSAEDFHKINVRLRGELYGYSDTIRQLMGTSLVTQGCQIIAVFSVLFSFAAIEWHVSLIGGRDYAFLLVLLLRSLVQILLLTIPWVLIMVNLCFLAATFT